MLINIFKDCTNTIVTEKTLDSLSRIVSSVGFKTGSQKEIQVVALNKTETQCTYQYPSRINPCSPVMMCNWLRS